METLFYLRIAFSFVLGGMWIAFTTVAAERLGSKRGGFIGGLPSTAIVALLFIGLAQGTHAAVEATTLMPFVQGISGLFLLTYIVSANRGLVNSMFCALGIWAVGAGALAASGVRSFPASVSVWIILTVGCYLVGERRLEIPSQERLCISRTKRQIVSRAVFEGGVIALAVLMSRLAGPVYGGILATFPAMFMSTLIVTHRGGGAAFSRAVAKSLLFSGLVNIPVYAILVRYSYSWVGLARGTFMAFVATSGVAYVIFRLMMARSS